MSDHTPEVAAVFGRVSRYVYRDVNHEMFRDLQTMCAALVACRSALLDAEVALRRAAEGQK